MKDPLGKFSVALSQQLESLHRINGVHRALQRKMHVKILNHDLSLIDNQLAFLERQLAHGFQELRQALRYP